ncbi:MAG: hypothetical protein ACRC92_20030 [Peptostreptococcaceae bacterium]
MNIKEDKELKFTIDKLTEYYYEIDEEIKILKENKKEIEKIIKSYIIQTQDLKENPNNNFIYEHKYLNINLNRKYSHSLLIKIKKLKLEELINNKQYSNIEIKNSIELIRKLIKSIDEEIDNTRKVEKQEILATYLNYINSIDSKDDQDNNIMNSCKINLIKYFFNSQDNYIKYIQIIDNYQFNRVDTIIKILNSSNNEINEKDYKIEITKKL